MIATMLLGIVTILELYLCSHLSTRYISGRDTDFNIFHICLLFALCSLFLFLSVMNKVSTYFSSVEWFVEDVLIIFIFVCMKIKHRSIKVLFAILVKHILICMDYAIAFALVSRKSDQFTVEGVLHGNIPEVYSIYLILRIVGIAFFFVIDIEKKLPDLKRNRRLLFLLDVLSFMFLLFLQIQFIHGNKSVHISYTYIAVGFCIMWGLVFSMYELIENNRERERFMTLKNESLEQSYQHLYNEQRRLERTAHDFKNHINLLICYLEDGEYQEALEYSKKLGNPLKIITQKSWSGHKMLDTILNTKFAEAEKKDIKVNAEIKAITKIPVADYDLCIIITNLFDNAIEACEYVSKENKKIRITVQSMNHVFIIKIENSIGRKPIKYGDSYRTTKENKRIHGIGLESVRAAVDKYHGTLVLEYDSRNFVAVVSVYQN